MSKMKRVETIRYSAAGRPGSILVFAVVVLAILAMLSTAFLVVTRHAILASRAATSYAQPDVTADAAQANATNFLHTATRHTSATLPIIISSTEGVVSFGTAGAPLSYDLGFDLTKSSTLQPATSTSACLRLKRPGDLIGTVDEVGGPGYGGPDNMGPMDAFRHDLPLPTSIPLNPAYAVLSLDPNSPYCKNPAGHYTISPLRITSSLAADAATPNFVRAALDEFYNPLPSSADPNGVFLRQNRTASPVTGAVRGRNFVWIRDLDACFFVNPAFWGLNDPRRTTNNSYDPNFEQVIAVNILESLRNNAESDMVTEGWTKPDMQNIADPTRLPFVNQHHPGDTHIIDVAGTLQTLNPIKDPNNYEFWRSDIESYFSAYLDTVRNTDGSVPLNGAGQPQPFAQVKTTPAGVNINTAPVEVIQAMLSQIPYADAQPFEPVPGAPNSFAALLAQRIVAKRPFLCRMDFEDFAATLLPGDPNDANTPLGAIAFAMTKRLGDRRAIAIQQTQPEISLAQFMELPGLPEGDYLNSDGSVFAVNPYKNANTMPNMLARFFYFLDDTSSAIGGTFPTRAQCNLTVKAFNNLLNSVSSSPGPSFHCTVVLPMDLPGATPHPANSVAIQFDPTDAYSPRFIQLGGDDVYDSANHCVTCGPNGIVETGVFGYSYYSHDSAVQEYKPYRLKDETNPPSCTDPAYCGKFIYGDSSNPNGFEPTNMLYKNYGIEDLHLWSCVGNGTLSGYYDMYFNFHDKMLMEYGEIDDGFSNYLDPAIRPSIVPDDGGMLQTYGGFGDDVQENNYEASISPGDPVVLPGPNKQLETSVSQLSKHGQPSDDRVVKAIRLAQDPANSNTDWKFGVDGQDFSSNDNGYDYIYPLAENGFKLITQLGPPSGDPNDTDILVDIIIDGGDGIVSTGASDDVLIVDNDMNDMSLPYFGKYVIAIGQNTTNNSYVWGPIRASQRIQDQLREASLAGSATPLPPQIPTAPYNTDVAWSPPICFRSRFYATYVLAQGLSSQPTVGTVPIAQSVGDSALVVTPTPPINPTLPKTVVPANATFVEVASSPFTGGPTVPFVYTIASVTGNTITLSSPLVAPIAVGAAATVHTSKLIGEKRIESIYDAYNDQILWSRSPLTDKRSLGE